MINLCGVGISNYYNKIKLVLLEKNIPFTEETVMPSQNEAVLQRSPLGKIPFIETERGNLSESQVILEYLEETYPEIPLYPADSFERAKCRELIQHLELNVELQIRRLYKEALFGGTVSDETKAEVKERLEVGLNGLARLAKFSPYIAGDQYSAADVVAWLHFFMISMVSEKMYGSDMLAAHLPNVASYMQLLETRPAVQKVAADRGAAITAFFSQR